MPSVFAFADRLEARAAPVASDPEPGIPLLVAASARFGELEMPFERAVTDLKLAEALIATGQTEEARASSTSTFDAG